MASKCSIGLHTRVKDKRNLIANWVCKLDSEKNIPFTEVDDKKKCEIFGIPSSNTDFITGKKLTGIGDHYYPLCADIKKDMSVGSDSLWNRIPVSGNNSAYKKEKVYIEKLEEWEAYVKERGATMRYTLKQEHLDVLEETVKELVQVNQAAFDKLSSMEL